MKMFVLVLVLSLSQLANAQENKEIKTAPGHCPWTKPVNPWDKPVKLEGPVVWTPPKDPYGTSAVPFVFIFLAAAGAFAALTARNIRKRQEQIE